MTSGVAYLEVEGAWLSGILELGLLSALLEKGIKLRANDDVSPHNRIRRVRHEDRESWSLLGNTDGIVPREARRR